MVNTTHSVDYQTKRKSSMSGSKRSKKSYNRGLPRLISSMLRLTRQRQNETQKAAGLKDAVKQAGGHLDELQVEQEDKIKLKQTS